MAQYPQRLVFDSSPNLSSARRALKADKEHPQKPLSSLQERDLACKAGEAPQAVNVGAHRRLIGLTYEEMIDATGRDKPLEGYYV